MSPLGMRPTDRSEFGIAIICALTLEADAIEALFDETYDKFGRVYGKHSGDPNVYITGRIDQHNVVLCYLPGIGIGSAAGAAANLQVSYTRIHLALVVGICGAVPFPSANTEIILGDIIISDCVIQYDFGRQYPDGFRQKSDVKEVFGRPNQEIRALLAALKGRKTRRELEAQIYDYVQILGEEEDVWQHPGLVNDVLFEASYHHKHREQRPDATCICFNPNSTSGVVCDEAVQKDCSTLGCTGNRITRRRCGINATTKPSVHIGSLASANTVMKSGEHRDRIAEREGVIGFEMEGADVWDSTPCIIIKGVCDYADSHKNKLWQDYAAATAASCAKAFLGYWTPRTTEVSICSSSSWTHTTSQICIRGKSLEHANEPREHPSTDSISLPYQPKWTELVVLNDALGETYYFSRNLIDSFELFMTILRRKFEHVGLRKIERGEWVLQDHRTGHSLNLNRNWKAIVKPGQTLDMSMTFRRRSLPTNLCPWCNTENEGSLDGQPMQCQQCSGRYGRTEQVTAIALHPPPSPAGRLELKFVPRWQPPINQNPHESVPSTWNERLTSCRSSLEEPSDDSNDVHLYTRIQMIDFHFRIVEDYRSLLGKLNPPLFEFIDVDAQYLDVQNFAEYLAKSSGIATEDCLCALQENSEMFQKLTHSVRIPEDRPSYNNLEYLLHGDTLSELNQLFA